MYTIARILTTTAFAFSAVAVVPVAAHAEEVAPDCASQQAEIERMSLLNFSLGMQMAELRDEHGDKVRALEDTLLEEQDERHDAEAALADARYQIAQRDARIDRLIAKVRWLRTRR